MASTSTEMPELSTAGTVPVLDTTPLHSQIAFRDLVRIVLLLIIPIYARMYLFSSIFTTFGHVYVISTTSICVVYFSQGKISLYSVWDIICGLLVSSFPRWGPSILSFLWVGPKIQGWRWEVVYWTFVASRLNYFLPENYGSDVEELIREYRHAYPNFQGYVTIISSAIVYFALWPKGCSWHEVLLIISIIGSFIQYGYLLYLNYAHLQKFGKTVRQDSWPYRGMYTRKWALDERGQPIRINHTFEEWMRFLATGDINPKNQEYPRRL
ncbi:hypothetical protein M431DRAFT_494909 [Trichoderma harzianum CBS 226.95]|uniref:Uncharacterized protein n=1 Tax=Trichoderma harzianum CBS 226.95 TaxID=983964 RepID=A0A2T4AC72_TRIHA|nr:hypothetical protein M431DRAFT_494909 [Trichoderma harzianum CBS 226.95]PTB54684.1 hypothetical protein M431DRAFT_494909 [Trichoderma harzianum CBS 226.95]